MKFKSLLKINLILIALVASFSSKADTYVDPLLINFINSRAVQTTKIVVLLKYDQQGIPAPARYNSSAVKRYLQSLYKQSVKNVFQVIAQNPGDMKLVNQFWINNSLGLEVTPNGLRKLTVLPNVEKIYANRNILYVKPVSGRLAPSRSPLEYPYDLKDLGIDELMKTNPEIQGKGVSVGVIDTGIDGKHPALQGKIALFYDAAANKITEPVDRDQHGTHVSGTIAGGDRTTTNIGVAPEAKIIGSAALDGYDVMLKAMQFMLDPDGNPETQDSPKLVSNSWNAGGAPDIELFYRAISAWEAAGILPVFSAGNSGPGAQTITTPHEHPSVFAVGATGKDQKIAKFSSRGPAKFKGQLVEKPDFTAPGVDIVSTIPGGKMASFSGTSMACPHVAGVSALLYQVNKNFTPAQIKEILMKTLTYVDSSGNPTTTPKWDPAYGFGRVNAFAAVKAAMALMGRNRFQSSVENFGFSFKPTVQLSNTQYSLNDITAAYPTEAGKWIRVSK
jgi:subtilisin family serine protease